MSPFEKRCGKGIDVKGVNARKLLKPLARHHPTGTGANEQQAR